MLEKEKINKEELLGLMERSIDKATDSEEFRSGLKETTERVLEKGE